MKLVERNCPHCGARLEIDEDKKKAFCMYCGAELTIDSEKPATPYNNAEAAGYEFEKGRQRAMEEIRAEQQEASANPYAGQSETYRKPKKHLFWWVVGWIFIFPIPLTILISRSKLPKWAKALIIVAAWAIYMGLSLANNDDEKTAILRRLTPLR